MQIIDSLSPGGAERVAVNVANGLIELGHDVTLCATRSGGVLQGDLSPAVKYLYLNRRATFDPAAIFRLIKLIRRAEIKIIHAHSSSIFLAAVSKIFNKRVKLIWHIHAGSLATKPANTFYKLAKLLLDGIIAVNQDLWIWAQDNELITNPESIWCVQNFVMRNPIQSSIHLPGDNGYRLVCVANLRPEKDHLTLIRAVQRIVKRYPETHLLLVGASNFPEVLRELSTEIGRLGLEQNVTWLGYQRDVHSIIAGCDIGVISSISEGLPLALLEYGTYGLAVVSTRVGECASVLDEGQGGLLVEPKNPEQLAEAILTLLENPELRKKLSIHLRERIKKTYSQQAAIKQISEIYSKILGHA